MKKATIIGVSILILIIIFQLAYIHLYPKITGYPLIAREDKDLNPCVEDITEINTDDYHVILEEDDMFKLSLYIQKKAMKTYRHISIFSTIEYVGEDDSIEVWSGNPFYGYMVHKGQTNYIMDTILTDYGKTKLIKGEVHTLPLKKSRGYSESEENLLYWKAYAKDEYIRLPNGKYDLEFRVDFDLSENGENYKKIIKSSFKVEE